jgi:uncharacterized protein
MDKRAVVIAALAAGGDGATFTPVQVQKIFFLIDRRAASGTNGPHFNFQPYDYGPFDNAVYDQLEVLQQEGLVEISWAGRYKSFKLTAAGILEGGAELQKLSAPIQSFLWATVDWVRSLRFDQLVAAIYREYPEMKVNSVFKQ